MATRGRKRGIEVRTPPGPKPEPPSWLTDEGRELWDQYSDTLNALGILERLDAISFANACEEIRRLQDMRAEFAREGSYTNTVGENGAIQAHPLATLIAQQVKTVLALCSEFGMTPRGRINLTGSLSCEPDAGAVNPMQQLLDEVAGLSGNQNVDGNKKVDARTAKPKRKADSGKPKRKATRKPKK